MPTLERFDVVVVPFPYVEQETRKYRPAVIVSACSIQEEHGLAWTVMITSARHSPWPDDIPIDDLALAGLPKPSVIRPAKVATVSLAGCEVWGRLSPAAADALAA